MLIMREDQLTLPIANEKGFVDWYVDEFMPEHIADFYESLDRPTMVKRVTYARKLALHFNFKDPVSMTHFVTLMWEIGPNFYTFPVFKEIAEDINQPSMKRIDRFYEVSDEQDMAATFGADEKAWNPSN